MKYYYIYWIDSIARFKKHNPHNKNWQLSVFIINTWINGLNLWILLTWLKYFNVLVIPEIDVNIFPGDMIDEFISFTIIFVSPFIFLNYILIFHRMRYQILMKKYVSPKRNITLIYSLSIILGAFFSAMLYGVLTNQFQF